MKLKLTALAFIATAMVATSAFASGGENRNTNCNGVGNPNSPCISTGGGPGVQSNTTITPVISPVIAPSVSATGGAGGSVSHSGNSMNLIGIDNRSSATGGAGGNATGGSVGNVTGVTGGVRSGDVNVGNGYSNFSPSASAKIEKGAVENTNVNMPIANGGSAKQGQLQGQLQGQQQGQQQATTVTNSGNNTGTAEVTVGGQSNSMTVNTVDPNSNANAKEAANALRDAAAADAAAKVAAANATAEAIRQAAREPIKNTPSMDAPALTSSNDTCMGSISGSVSLPGFGLGAGTTMIDENCVMLKNSRELWNMGMKAASLARMCMDDKNREALEITGYTCPSVKAKKDAETKAAADKAPTNTALYSGS